MRAISNFKRYQFQFTPKGNNQKITPKSTEKKTCCNNNATYRNEADRLKRQSRDTKKTRLAEKLESGNDIRETAENEAPGTRLTGSKSRQKRA